MVTLGGGSLPAGYTQVEYIQSTGTQYIGTNFEPNQDTRVTVDFMFDEWGTGTTFLFGVQNSANTSRYCLGVSSSGTLRNDYGTQYTSVDIIKKGVRYTADKNKNVFTYSGSTMTWTQNAETFSNTMMPMRLFSRYYTSDYGYLKGKIYNLKIYDNGTLVRNFVPARNSSNVLGMYDTVNNQFYTNLGTGTFVGGAEVNNDFIAGA